MTGKTKKILLAAGAVIIIAIVYFYSVTGTKEKELTVKVKRGKFEINVFTTGELEAKNSVNIDGPQGLRSIGIWQAKIADLVPEGTIVQKGGYIASLDKSEISTKIRDAENELQKIESQYTQAKLDTALQLRSARDEIANLEFSIKEKQIIVEQSEYEPPATIRQANLDLDRARRSLQQAYKNYDIKKRQAIAKMQEVGASLNTTTNKLEQLNKVLQEFTIVAPEPGMVIYQREWNGKRKTVGSTISGWDPTVATLPDLSVMMSRTFVNEVDVRKVKVDQKVNVTLDAFPEKRLSGKVISVANVGEQNPKSDAKVFEVHVQILEKDTSLRPAMTTGNNIIVGEIKDALFVPLECIHNQGDSLSYVFLKEGLLIKRKEVKLGQTNENHVVILEGLKENQELLLGNPGKAEEYELETLVPEKKKG